MKKHLTLIAGFVLIFSLAGCGKTEQRELSVLSFCGENDLISVSNGVIVLDISKEILYGGDLEVNDDEFTDIAGYTTTIYLENSKQILMSHSNKDETGGTINISGNIGKISGDILGDADIEKVTDLLWFELETIDLHGEENTYQLKLELTEITGMDNN